MEALGKLIHELAKLPGIGHKSATRLAYHLLNSEAGVVDRLSASLVHAKRNTKLCGQCFTYTESELCPICRNSSRASGQIAVVERPSDVDAIEATGNFNGKYHVLHGVLSPVEGIGTEDIRLRELVTRIAKLMDEGRPDVEVILALNPSVEGEATGLYVNRILKPFQVKISKIAYGLPMGGALEYADRMTISKAIANRVEC